jgi:thiamine-monophosphate kinase
LFTIKQSDFETIKNNPDISIIGHVTEASAGCNLISKSQKVHPIKAQGWNSLKGTQE